jgi:hypothetical protein
MVSTNTPLLNFGHGCVKPQTGRIIEIAALLNPPPVMDAVVAIAVNHTKVSGINGIAFVVIGLNTYH